MGARGEERLKAITDAATEVVAERGYYGMTIQEVSDRVGITQAGLLKYVKNKNGLLMLDTRISPSHRTMPLLMTSLSPSITEASRVLVTIMV